jgi:hypothetical protein
VLPLLVPGLFLFRRGAAAARSSPGTSLARWCGRVLPWSGAAAAPPSPPSHGALSGGVERENPNGVCGLDGWPSTFPLAFESRRSNGRAKSLCCPGLDCPGDRGGAASSFERARSQGRGAGVKEDFHPVRVRPARERVQSLGVRVAWLVRPSHRAPPARCGLVDPPSGAGKGEKR